jgi:ABC-type protease/lipase transport system fused ATPase/permease subunit
MSYRVGGKAVYESLTEAKAAANSIFVVTGNVVAVEEVDKVQAFMDRKMAEPGFGKRRYGVRASVGKATVTLHKSAKYGKAA